MKMWRDSRPWCITISIFKGATRLPCQRRWLAGSCVHCAILMRWINSEVYPSFLFHSYSDPFLKSQIRRDEPECFEFFYVTNDRSPVNPDLARNGGVGGVTLAGFLVQVPL